MGSGCLTMFERSPRTCESAARGSAKKAEGLQKPSQLEKQKDSLNQQIVAN